MAKRHYIPVTADVPGAASEGNCALIRKVIRTALAAEGVDVPCEVDVLLTNDSGIHEINREMRQVDASTDVLSFPEFDLRPGELPAPEDADPGTGLVPLGDMVISMEHVAAQAREYGLIDGIVGAAQEPEEEPAAFVAAAGRRIRLTAAMREQYQAHVAAERAEAARQDEAARTLARLRALAGF